MWKSSPDGARVLPHGRLRATLDYLSSCVTDPAQKLWFIKKTLADYAAKPELLRRLPLVRGLVFHFVALESFGTLARHAEDGVVEFPRAPLWLFYYTRHVLLAVAVAALCVSAVHLYGASTAASDWLFAKLIPTPVVASTTGLDFHPNRSSKPPTNVWLVTENDGEELWSNGLRIDTKFAISAEPRRFLAFPRDGSDAMERSGGPVGIVYHASQNDMAPFDPDFNRDILDTTKALLGWLKRREIYHYMIDRFGRVYRIVDEGSVAIHAGESIWADDDYFYLNLNESFIGIALESRWNTGRDLITAAQVQAATNLTDMLRLRYKIEDINCVPHGLVSVNANDKLIGYHADWARGFPFNAIGLDNKYRIPPPSVAAFGFRYDEDLVARLGGELWEGVERAEAELRAQASDAAKTPAALRRELREHYDELRAKLH